MSVVGVVFAALTRSEAILLDGIFNGISVVSLYLSARLASVIHCRGDKTFQFGYAHFEPLVNTTRGLLILAVALFAFFSAVGTILNGGSRLNPGLAVVYSILVGIGCGIMALVQKRRAVLTQSPMVKIDAQNWILNAAITAVVCVAFLLAFILQNTKLKGVVPYVDSVLVIVLTVIALPVPVRSVIENVRQVFQMAPDEPTQLAVHERTRQALGHMGTDETRIRMARIGRFLYVVAGVVVKDSYKCDGVAALDDLRRRLEKQLSDLDEQVVVDTLFTEDHDFASLRIMGGADIGRQHDYG
jgi:predicted Co/Zn/Cd cation transporter (cation efflux family)